MRNPFKYTRPNSLATTIPSVPDLRDWVYTPRTQKPFLPYLDLMPDVDEVKDQSVVGACVTNGFGGSVESIIKAHAGDSIDVARMPWYTMSKILEGRLSEDGLSPRTALKIGKHYGLLLESDYPYLETLQYLTPPESAYLEAINSGLKIAQYRALVPPSVGHGLETQHKIDLVMGALNDGYSVDVAFQINESILKLTGPWEIQQYKPDGIFNRLIGGHQLKCVGYSTQSGKFLLQNSWGRNYGDGGFLGIPCELMVDALYFEAWVITQVERNGAVIGIPEAPGIKLEYLGAFQIEARIVPKPAEVGQTMPVWIGAVLTDGSWFLKTDMSDNGWLPIIPGSHIDPCMNLTLQETNLVNVVNWTYLEPFKGAAVYVAYGSLDNPVKVCTVPYNL